MKILTLMAHTFFLCHFFSYTHLVAAEFFVATTGSDNKESGSINSPYASITYAAKQAKPGDYVYVRGGEYANKGYLNNDIYKKGVTVNITVSGAPGAPITFMPYLQEKVKIKFDHVYGIQITGNYITVSGFEIEGVAALVTYEEVLSHWWEDKPPSRYSGAGIITRGHHITIQNNVVHHCTAKGIGGTNGDYIITRNNIVYNCSWWTLGGPAAIEFYGLTIFDEADAPHIEITGNLVFGCEQRIFSRIFNKGFANLSIDEGPGIGSMLTNIHSTGKYHLINNLALYNGKGLEPHSNRWIIRNNSVYMQTTTVGGSTTGLVLRGVLTSPIENNACQVGPTYSAFNYKPENNNTITNNYIIGKEKQEDVPPGVTVVTQLYRDPNNLDFRVADGIPDNVGVPEADLNRMFAKVAEYGISVKPTGWVMDYYGQTKWIVENRPAEKRNFELKIAYDYTNPNSIRYDPSNKFSQLAVLELYKGVVSIRVPNNGPASVELLSAKGNLIRTQSIGHGNASIDLREQNIPNGYYILMLRQGDRVVRVPVPLVD